MKKLLLPVLLILTLVIAACGNTEKKDDAASGSKNETITYKSENGDIKVPANPKRVVVLAGFAGNVMALDVPVVGVDSWSKANPKFDKLKDVTEVSEENVEKIIELEPDLIIGYARGYRASWETCLCDLTEDVLLDNTSAWSADHCADALEVPGVLWCNHALRAGTSPSLVDLAPSILAAYGLSVPESMTGRNVFAD